jgi:hypothetical protein
MLQQQAPLVELPRMVDAAGRELSLLEMTRVMDVARTLRREKSIAEQQLNLGETKSLLKRKLREAADLAGDRVTDDEIAVAIENYYQNLHEFRPPESGWELVLASLYVRRGPIAKWTLAMAAAAALLWGLWFSGILPGAPRSERLASSLYRDVLTAAEVVETSTQLPLVKQQVEQSLSRAEVLRASGDLSALASLREELTRMSEVLDRRYQVVVADGAQSAIYRLFDDSQISGYYLLVQAVDASGNVLPMPIRNAETGKIETVRRWGEQIPEVVYRRLEADKLADGVLDEREFGVKEKGQLDEQVVMRDEAGNLLTRGRQITQW